MLLVVTNSSQQIASRTSKNLLVLKAYPSDAMGENIPHAGRSLNHPWSEVVVAVVDVKWLLQALICRKPVVGQDAQLWCV